MMVDVENPMVKVAITGYSGGILSDYRIFTCAI